MTKIESITESKEKLFQLLISEAFFKEKVILSSGKESNYYFDVRRVTLSSQGVYLCARIILDFLKEESYDAIGGPTLGADPIVGAIGVLSYQANKPIRTFIVRKSPKVHGKQQQIEGPLLERGTRVILIDDVATTGKALVEAIEVLSHSGIQVSKAVCIIDRNEGAREELAHRNCQLVSIFKAQEFLSAE